MQPDSVSRRSARAIIVMFIGLIVLTALDLGSKEWALNSLSTARSPAERSAVCEPGRNGHLETQRKPAPPVPLVAGVLNLYYAENCGAAFSMLRDAPAWLRLGVFGGASLGAAVVLIGMFVRGAGGALFAVAVPFIVSGALGNNLSDRPRHGFVVDFIQVDPSLFRYPIFNVADIWIAIGVGLLLIDGMRTPRKSERDEPAVPIGAGV